MLTRSHLHFNLLRTLDFIYCFIAFDSNVGSSTMVTAILPSIVTATHKRSIRPAIRPLIQPSSSDQVESHHSTSPSLSSELTITPARLARAQTPVTPSSPNGILPSSDAEPRLFLSPSRLAGVVGLFTGCGALLALVAFLPLPTRFAKLRGVSAGQALAYSYYVVGSIALLVAGFCFVGLRKLKGEDGNDKEERAERIPNGDSSRVGRVYWRSVLDAIMVGFQDVHIGLGYLGGFVARSVFSLVVAVAACCQI